MVLNYYFTYSSTVFLPTLGSKLLLIVLILRGTRDSARSFEITNCSKKQRSPDSPWRSLARGRREEMT